MKLKNKYCTGTSVFRYPKISRHAGGGCASPSWVIIYWGKVDWLVIDETANILLSELYKWIQLNSKPELKLTDGKKFVPSPERATDMVLKFQNILKEEIKIEFREPEAEKLINIVEKYEIVAP